MTYVNSRFRFSKIKEKANLHVCVIQMTIKVEG